MADRRKIRFLRVDDHALLREGIAALLAVEQDMPSSAPLRPA